VTSAPRFADSFQNHLLLMKENSISIFNYNETCSNISTTRDFFELDFLHATHQVMLAADGPHQRMLLHDKTDTGHSESFLHVDWHNPDATCSDNVRNSTSNQCATTAHNRSRIYQHLPPFEV
jgi:hypothetical protein